MGAGDNWHIDCGPQRPSQMVFGALRVFQVNQVFVQGMNRKEKQDENDI